MSKTLDSAGRPLFLPPPPETETGLIPPRTAEELAHVAHQVAPQQLLPFLRRLINATSKRKRRERRSAINLQRMELARLCIDRVIAEGLCCQSPSHDA